MRKDTDVLIIGAGPAGIVCALTARWNYPDKKILVMRDVEKGVIPCGIPYMFASLQKPEQNAMSYASLEQNEIELVVDQAVKIDRKNKVVYTKKGDEYHYEKLVLAIGSRPVVPPIRGLEGKDGIYVIKKDLDYLVELVNRVKRCKKVVIVGGGFIGVEVADELSKLQGMEVAIIEMLSNLLPLSFDPEFCKLAEDKLRAQGVKIFTGTKVEEILGEDRVRGVRLSNGQELEADCLILAVGFTPNTQLALDAGLELDGKGIWVDEYMRTVDSDIFAVGDCASKRDFFTRKGAPVMLASVATAEARIAGANLYGLKVLREAKGTIGVFSTYVSGLVLASAGLTETKARREGFDVVVGKAEAVDKHPGALSGAQKTIVKLVFSREGGFLLGGQVAGGIPCGELINAVGVAIQKRFTIADLETFQMATHPYLTPAPTLYPLVLAAQDAARKLKSG